MDLFDLFRVLWRRWYVVVPVGLAALGLAWYVQTSTPPELEASGYLQWDLPQYDAAQQPVSQRLDPAALSQGIDLPDEVGYSVGPLEGQYFEISAAAESLQDAETAVDEVIAQLGARISRVQDEEGIPESRQTDLRTVTPDAVIEVQPDDTVIATAQMFLYDPVASVVNPYSPAASTGRLLQIAVSSDAGRQRFAQLAGPEVVFEVAQQARDAAALIAVVVTGPDETQVLAAFDVIADLMNEDLEARQTRAGVPPSQRIALRVLDAPLAATDVSPPVGRATIGIIGLGGLLALGAAFGVEAIAARRRREQAPPPPPGPPWTPASELDELVAEFKVISTEAAEQSPTSRADT